MHGALLPLTFNLHNEQIRINNDIKYFKKDWERGYQWSNGMKVISNCLTRKFVI